MTYNFAAKLENSRGSSEKIDLTVLKDCIDGCLSVIKTDVEIDKKGIDYIAELRSGATINIDAKTRESGCSKYWTNGPELALETWSVMPTKVSSGKVGWTLSEKSNVDLILYTYDISDSDTFYLLPFQHLRMSFRKNYNMWKTKYKTAQQSSGTWTSQCMFVPAIVVLEAIKGTSILKYANTS